MAEQRIEDADLGEATATGLIEGTAQGRGFVMLYEDSTGVHLTGEFIFSMEPGMDYSEVRSQIDQARRKPFKFSGPQYKGVTGDGQINHTGEVSDLEVVANRVGIDETSGEVRVHFTGP